MKRALRNVLQRRWAAIQDNVSSHAVALTAETQQEVVLRGIGIFAA